MEKTCSIIKLELLALYSELVFHSELSMTSKLRMQASLVEIA